MENLTKQQARQFILTKQGLLGKYRFTGKKGAYDYIRQAGCIQYDPIDVCGKNAELTLQSRIRGFRKKMLNELLYQDRLLVDYADKEMSIWPAEDWPYFHALRERSRLHGAGIPGMTELEERALSYIRENGPVSGDTLPIEGEIMWHSAMHWSGSSEKNSKAARSVLEQLYTEGRLVIHHKNGSRKFYDLAERHIDPSVLQAEAVPEDEYSLLCRRILRRIGAAGLLWNRNSAAFTGIRMSTDQRRQAFSLLESSGAAVPVHVEGIRTVFYYLAEDRQLMQDVLAGNIDRKPRLELIAPLDPLFWDKNLIASLWDFRYSWEIYTPADQRKYGYYVLPVLRGEQFIGRIEPVCDHKNRILHIKNIWFEDGISMNRKLMNELDRTLHRFARFNDCADADVIKL